MTLHHRYLSAPALIGRYLMPLFQHDDCWTSANWRHDSGAFGDTSATHQRTRITENLINLRVQLNVSAKSEEILWRCCWDIAFSRMGRTDLWIGYMYIRLLRSSSTGNGKGVNCLFFAGLSMFNTHTKFGLKWDLCLYMWTNSSNINSSQTKSNDKVNICMVAWCLNQINYHINKHNVGATFLHVQDCIQTQTNQASGVQGFPS